MNSTVREFQLEAEIVEEWVPRCRRLEMENIKLASALRGLYEDNVDYLRINKLGGMDNHWLVIARTALGLPPPADNDHVAEGCEQFASQSPSERIAQLETALQSLWPGLVLDLRYADADDDKDAMQSRIDTIRECFAEQRTVE